MAMASSSVIASPTQVLANQRFEHIGVPPRRCDERFSDVVFSDVDAVLQPGQNTYGASGLGPVLLQPGTAAKTGQTDRRGDYRDCRWAGATPVGNDMKSPARVAGPGGLPLQAVSGANGEGVADTLFQSPESVVRPSHRHRRRSSGHSRQRI